MYRLFLVPFLLAPAAALAQVPMVPPALPSVQPPDTPLPATTFVEPYARLFGGSSSTQTWRREPPSERRQPGAPGSVVAWPRTKVVCGTTLIIVDGGEVDPRMAQTPRPDGPRYSMRRVPPPACGKAEGKK